MISKVLFLDDQDVKDLIQCIESAHGESGGSVRNEVMQQLDPLHKSYAWDDRHPRNGQQENATP